MQLLNSALASAVSSSSSPIAATVPVPPPSHLALLSSLVVHPLHTTRAEGPELRLVSALALDYLRNLLALVGPLKAGFGSAFRFSNPSRWGRRSGRLATACDSSASDDDDDDDDGGSPGPDVDQLRGRMANQESVWVCGQDLWSVVGWAFNTASLHPHRWTYWRVWLTFLLDLLDADWCERQRRDDEALEARQSADSLPMGRHEEEGEKKKSDEEEGGGETTTAWRRNSMIALYMNRQGDRRIGLRRILQALFADGHRLAMSSFPAVFEKEDRGPRKSSSKRKREQTVDLEKGDFGDYLDDESLSSGISEPPTPRGQDQGETETRRLLSSAEAESVTLRLRFFRLLSGAVCALGPRPLLNQLYEEVAVVVKSLPLPMFCLFVSQRENPLLPETHVTLIKELFHLLLPSNYPDPGKVDPEAEAYGSLTMSMLERCYMPYPANTVGSDDNAKLSVVEESAMQLLWNMDSIEYSEALAQAATKGIESRLAKAKKKKRNGRRREEAGDGLAEGVLTQSGERIQAMMRALKG